MMEVINEWNYIKCGLTFEQYRISDKIKVKLVCFTISLISDSTKSYVILHLVVKFHQTSDFSLISVLNKSFKYNKNIENFRHPTPS